MQGASNWSLDECRDEVFRHKFVDVVRILGEWFEPFGGLCGKDVLEFGCGEATMSLGVALQHEPRRMVGVEILDVVNKCLPIARQNLGMDALPANLELRKIAPGEDISALGEFDAIFTWSVFEHVSRDLLPGAFETLKRALKPEGAIFLQISPLFYSPDGSHLAPWIPAPWAHLRMQSDAYRAALFAAPETSTAIRSAWSVYIDPDADRFEERRALWETYETLNKATAPQLERCLQAAGLRIERDYRTWRDDPIPEDLREIYQAEVLGAEQIVWILRHVAES